MSSSYDLSADADGTSLPAIGAAKRLGVAPIAVAVAALAVSVGLIFFRLGSFGPFVGWLLTPFVVVGCLAWARILVVARSSDPWFDRPDARRKLRVLQGLTLLAFIASLPHVWRIGQEVALWLQ